MARESRMHNLMSTNVADYVQMNEEIDEKRDEFMTKFLRRNWPLRLSAVLGTFQLIIGLIIMAVDLPIILMFAPRWEVFVAGWTLIATLITSISTLHTGRKHDDDEIHLILIRFFKLMKQLGRKSNGQQD